MVGRGRESLISVGTMETAYSEYVVNIYNLRCIFLKQCALNRALYIILISRYVVITHNRLRQMIYPSPLSVQMFNLY